VVNEVLCPSLVKMVKQALKRLKRCSASWRCISGNVWRRKTTLTQAVTQK